jgi:hypothetical protein
MHRKLGRPRFFANLRSCPFLDPSLRLKRRNPDPEWGIEQFGEIPMRKRWSIAIHHETKSDDSLISEDHFIHFADVHDRMKKNKDKIFVVKIPKTAKPMEVQAFSNLRKLGYRVETI